VTRADNPISVARAMAECKFLSAFSLAACAVAAPKDRNPAAGQTDSAEEARLLVGFFRNQGFFQQAPD